MIIKKWSFIVKFFLKLARSAENKQFNYELNNT